MTTTELFTAQQGKTYATNGIYNKIDGTVTPSTGGQFPDSDSSYLIDVRGYSFLGITVRTMEEDVNMDVTAAYGEYNDLTELVELDFEIELLDENILDGDDFNNYTIDIRDLTSGMMATALWVSFSSLITNPTVIDGFVRASIKPTAFSTVDMDNFNHSGKFDRTDDDGNII